MEEMVLGFKKKDSYKHSLRCGDAVFPDDWVIADKKLVPVVSVEWLKKWCKENTVLVDIKGSRAHVPRCKLDDAISAQLNKKEVEK